MQPQERQLDISTLSSNQRAMLRREVGKPLEEASAKALQAFYLVLPTGVKDYHHKTYFAVVCMMCLWKEDRQTTMTFAQCISMLRTKEQIKEKSINSRLASLLDAPWYGGQEFLVTKLARYARQIKASEKNLYPDFNQLLEDLKSWDSSTRWVQRKWIQDYVQIQDEGNQNNEEEK